MIRGEHGMVLKTVLNSLLREPIMKISAQLQKGKRTFMEMPQEEKLSKRQAWSGRSTEPPWDVLDWRLWNRVKLILFLLAGIHWLLNSWFVSGFESFSHSFQAVCG